MTVKSCADNNPSTIALKVICYKMMETRKVRNPLLITNYIAICMYNHSIFKRFYRLSDNVSGL
jgi:hypothetical protein